MAYMSSDVGKRKFRIKEQMHGGPQITAVRRGGTEKGEGGGPFQIAVMACVRVVLHELYLYMYMYAYPRLQRRVSHPNLVACIYIYIYMLGDLARMSLKKPANVGHHDVNDLQLVSIVIRFKVIYIHTCMHIHISCMRVPLSMFMYMPTIPSNLTPPPPPAPPMPLRIDDSDTLGGHLTAAPL